jgi:hypothetical protein
MADTKVTLSQLKELCTKFSVKNFVADLPRMLNEAFTVLYNCITSFYNPDDNSIKCDKLNVTYVDATTIVAQNLRFKGSDGVIYNYNDIGTILSNIEKKLNSINNITKEQIDSLEMYPFQPWPLYADYYMIPPQNPEIGCKVLTNYGIRVYDVDNETNTEGWYDTKVTDGVMYICGENMNLYKRDEISTRWIDLGTYSNNK